MKITRPLPSVFIVSGLCLALLAGCSGDQLTHSMGLARHSPDEYTVTTRAPLTIPTDFTLPSPAPGAPRPQEISPTLAAEAALDPAVVLQGSAATDTPGQDALVRLAGPASMPDIRHYLDANAQKLNRRGGIGNQLAFWEKTPIPGKVVDAPRESRRLSAAGIPTVSPPAAP